MGTFPTRKAMIALVYIPQTKHTLELLILMVETFPITIKGKVKAKISRAYVQVGVACSS